LTVGGWQDGGVEPIFVLVHGSNSNSFGRAAVQTRAGVAGAAVVGGGPAGARFGASFPARYQAPQHLEAAAAAPSALTGVRPFGSADALTPDNPFDVHTLDSSHLRFLIHPWEAAGVLAGLVGAPR
jgi:hypothetical protein